MAEKWQKKLREAIEKSGKSASEIARIAKVSQPSVSRFFAGTRSVSLSIAEKIAAVVGLELLAKNRDKP